jgi:hypothetical protein
MITSVIVLQKYVSAIHSLYKYLHEPLGNLLCAVWSQRQRFQFWVMVDCTFHSDLSSYPAGAVGLSLWPRKVPVRRRSRSITSCKQLSVKRKKNSILQLARGIVLCCGDKSASVAQHALKLQGNSPCPKCPDCTSVAFPHCATFW